MARPLDARLRKFARRHGGHRKFVWPPLLLGLLFTAIGVPGTFGLDTLGEERPLGVFFWIGLVVVVAGVVFSLAWTSRVGQLPGVFSASQIRRVLAEGERVRAEVESAYTLHAYMEGEIPFSVMELRLAGDQRAAFGSFAEATVPSLSRGDTIEVLWHPAVPELAIPASVLDD